ncbi:MAG: cold shock domain-containing protein [Actinomycetota bacterium]|nr:cold shock domain-containing protein [Actinomycetota bacterium]MDA8315349.1 cold shock domain-containing protein [Actinomycetota bacterium]
MDGSLHLGVVSAFDEARGLGTVADDADATWPFHCTQIADGTRSVEVGRRVAFDVVAGHLGRMEAVRVTKL